MRYASYRWQGTERVGVIEGDRLYDLNELLRIEGGQGPAADGARPGSMLEFIRLGTEFIGRARAALQAAENRRTSEPDRWALLRSQGIVLTLQELEGRGGRLLAPIPRPAKNLVCLGRNYGAHAAERGEDVPEVPVFFTKAPTVVIAPGDAIRYPEATRMLDYEGELAVVIGKGGYRIPKERALDHVFGYTILNDVTARDLQRRHQQWFRGKSLDTFGPMGPWIVPAAEVPDPQTLRIRTWVNGGLRQDASTSQMIFSVAETIAWLSDGITLEPGDIISTGTPAGVGESGGEATLLHPGDRVRIEIERIGILENPVE